MSNKVTFIEDLLYTYPKIVKRIDELEKEINHIIEKSKALNYSTEEDNIKIFAQKTVFSSDYEKAIEQVILFKKERQQYFRIKIKVDKSIKQLKKYKDYKLYNRILIHHFFNCVSLTDISHNFNIPIRTVYRKKDELIKLLSEIYYKI